MSGNRTIRFARASWVDIAWVIFIILNLLAMRFLPGWQTVPFLIIWVSLTAIYGFRLWRLGSTLLTVLTVTPATGGLIGSLAVAEVPGDAERLTTALDALIENAVSHTDMDGRIELSSRREGESVVLAVTDSGSGIAAAEVERIFSRFSRTDAGRNRKAGGFALGLAIVKAIAEAHNGSVHVRSTVGEGSAFELHLPASVDQASSRQLLPPSLGRSPNASAWRIRQPSDAGRAGTAGVRRSGGASAQ